MAENKVISHASKKKSGTSHSVHTRAEGSPATVYTAHPLNLGSRDNIRLIRVLQNTDPDDPVIHISIDIQTVRLDDAPSYTALSYVWGEADPTKTIKIAGQSFRVRVNLWDFLERVQREGYSGYLWIDALCIDQLSIAERNHQVAMMAQIYSRASTVIPWLSAEPQELVAVIKKEYRI